MTNKLYQAFVDAIQPAEEIGGPKGDEYVLLMEKVAAEANRRASIARSTPEEKLYLSEFPDYGPLDFEIPRGFEDISWHNDACPSFRNEELHLTFFADYADPNRSEFGLHTDGVYRRFTLLSVDGDGEIIGDGKSFESFAELAAEIDRSATTLLLPEDY